MVAYIKVFNLSLILTSLLVYGSAWKKCVETFCDRVRKSPDGFERYLLDLNSVKIDNDTIEANLNQQPWSALKFSLAVFKDFTVHIHISESKTTTPRYRELKALEDINSLEKVPLTILNRTNDAVTVGYNKISILIFGNSFKVEIYNENKLISVINDPDKFVFERGPANFTIGMGVSFPETQRAYGIPEHADRLALRNTGRDGEEPYRHFNLDYGHYRLNSTESIYGAIGVLYAHGITRSSGIFWLNAAQTWIDVMTANNKVEAFFMSESGDLEMFILMGPGLADAVKQYAKLTGKTPLPQLFTLGYHQSRYSYMTQTTVLNVIDNFDTNNFPVDAIWLDIDYTDLKKYFTWDPMRFSDPQSLQDRLTVTNRKLVAIIDPHIKVEKNYFLHEKLTEEGYYVKNSDGKTDYVGECWPGNSSYIDFLNRDALEYYASLYSNHHFQGKNIHLWNDMNEPAIFNNGEHENTMAWNLLHDNGKWKHRDVHNVYGFYQTIGTRKGLLDRQPNLRPFILTRAHFAGIQRYAAIWTGDNVATWDYLDISVPMCLSEALAGVSFCGADVGGFANVPDDELYQRWYQAGAWLPFYRGHSAIDVPRREPYLYNEDIQRRVRYAMRLRYAHLPVWYTLFREHEFTGEPVIRPITYHYPTEQKALSIDNQILIGSDILAAPILKPSVNTANVYLPGGESELWYNIDDNYKLLTGIGYHTLTVTMDSLPVFYKGGSIISRKDTPRRTTVDMHQDPYTIYICPNKNQTAEGVLYIDDYQSFEYKNKKYVFVRLLFKDNILEMQKIDSDANYDNKADIYKAIVLNPPQNVTSAKLTDATHQEHELKISYNNEKTSLTISGFSVKPENQFKIVLSILESSSNSDGSGCTIFKLNVILFTIIMTITFFNVKL